MSKIFSKTVLAGVAAVGLALAAPAAQNTTTTKTLSGHVPSVISAMASIGTLPATNVLHLAIGLPVRDQARLDALVQSISDPASPNYRHYLLPAEFTEQFGPTVSDYQAVIDFAQSKGLTVTATHPNRLIVDVSGTAPAIQSAFQINLKTYAHPTENRTFYAPTSEPVVGASLSILHISGLDNYSIPQPMIKRQPKKLGNNVSPNIGSGPFGNFIGNDFRKAYVPGTTLTGAGQNVGLLQFDGFFPSDPADYAALIGLANPPTLVVVPVNGGVPTPGGGNGEVCLDIEMIFSMAPGVQNIYVYEAPNPSPWVDILSRIANDNLAKQIGCSWGGGPQNATAEQIFQQMAVQGQSFFNASGDQDAFVDQINPILFPADSPHITQVGGTALITGAGGAYASESGWNERFPYRTGALGSCGGISTFYPIPVWQQGISMTANQGSTTFRNIPDVALTAQDVWTISDSGQAGQVSGTSAAAPLWAGFMALVNQQANASGKQPIGFVNPSLYTLAKSANYTNVFHDCVTGDNTWPGSPTNFFAVSGYDLCTGLGSPNGTNMIFALVALASTGTNTAVISAPPGPWGTNLAVMNGSNPNGAWFLFVQDDAVLDVGKITNGWYVSLTTADLVGQAADNAIYASQTNTTIPFATNYTVTLSVTNYGPSASSNVLVTDTLPASSAMPLVSSNHTAGAVSVVGTTLTWNVGNLQTNAGASLTLVLRSLASGTFINTATVSSITTDPNPDDDTAVSTITVTAPPAPPVLASFSFPGGTNGFRLSVTGDPAYPTTVQASTNLVNWIDLFTGAPPFSYTNFGTTNYPARFYRAVVGP